MMQSKTKRGTAGEKAADAKAVMNKAADAKVANSKTALVQAVDLLARQEQSSGRLREKLAHRGYEPEEIDQAITKLEDMHYLNDADACQRQFNYFYENSRLSARQICLKLMQRSFPKDLIDACVPENTEVREREAALKVLALKYRRPAPREKLYQHLYSKGFDSSVIRMAVEEFTAGWDNDDKEDNYFD